MTKSLSVITLSKYGLNFPGPLMTYRIVGVVEQDGELYFWLTRIANVDYE